MVWLSTPHHWPVCCQRHGLATLPQDHVDQEAVRRVGEGYGGHRVIEGVDGPKDGCDANGQRRHGRVHKERGRTALAVVRGNPPLAPVEAPLENLSLEGHGRDGRDTQSVPFGPPSARSKIGLQGHFHGGELKAQIDAMLLFAVEVIYDQPVLRLDEEHTAAMLQRILHGGIGIVLDVGEVDIVVREPLTQVRLRMAVPSERPCRHGLVQSVDAHRAVRSSAPEVIAPVWLGSVAVRARIYDELLAKCRALQAEEIGVAMAGGGWTADGSGVEDQMVRLRVPAT